MTQSDLARRLSSSREAVSNWEQGRRSLGATDIPELAQALNVDVNYFYDVDPVGLADMPPELQMVYEAQGKIYEDLPPGPARKQYLDSLRANAEAMRAAVGNRLDKEEQ